MSSENQETSMDQSTATTGSETISQQSTPTGNDWLGTLPEDLRADPSLSSIKDIPSLAKGYVSAQRMLGSRIPIPSQEASEEVRNEFYSKLTNVPGILRMPQEGSEDYAAAVSGVLKQLGCPSDPKGYSLSLPEGMPVDEEYVSSITSLAHKAGLTRDQFKVLSEFEVNKSINAFKESEEARTSAVDTLTKAWGNKFNENMTLCKNVMSKYAATNQDAANEIINGPAGNNPVVLMMLADLGRTFQQEGTLGINRGVSGSRTPEEAKALIADINGNGTHPYHDHSSPAHQEAVKKMQSLFMDAYPEVDTRDDMFK